MKGNKQTTEGGKEGKLGEAFEAFPFYFITGRQAGSIDGINAPPPSPPFFLSPGVGLTLGWVGLAWAWLGFL